MEKIITTITHDQERVAYNKQTHEYFLDDKLCTQLSISTFFDYFHWLHDNNYKPAKWQTKDKMNQSHLNATSYGNWVHEILKNGEIVEKTPDNVKKFITKNPSLFPEASNDSISTDEEVAKKISCVNFKEVIVWNENLIGVIDLLSFQKDNQVIIADYKTNQTMNEKTKNRTFLKLKTYAYILHKKYNIPLSNFELQIVWLPRVSSHILRVLKTRISPTDMYKIIQMYNHVAKNLTKIEIAQSKLLEQKAN